MNVKKLTRVVKALEDLKVSQIQCESWDAVEKILYLMGTFHFLLDDGFSYNEKTFVVEYRTIDGNEFFGYTALEKYFGLTTQQVQDIFSPKSYPDTKNCQSVIQRLRWYLERFEVSESIFDENNKMDKSVFIFSTQLIINCKHLQNCDLEILYEQLQVYWEEYVFSEYYDADTSYLQSIHDFFKSKDLNKGATP